MALEEGFELILEPSETSEKVMAVALIDQETVSESCLYSRAEMILAYLTDWSSEMT